MPQQISSRSESEIDSSIVDLAPEAIFIQSGGRFAYVNEAAVVLFGAECREQLLGQPVEERFHSNDRPGIRERMRQLEVERRVVPQVEETALKLDGTTVRLEVNAIPFDYGGCHGALVFARDITARKAMELRSRAFSALGQRLSAAQTAKEAARIIVAVADQLLGWDLCLCDLYSPEKDIVSSVLGMDIIDGKRTECGPLQDHSQPTPLARRAIEHGGQLILKKPGTGMAAGALPFGDISRPSASIMYVPIRNGAKVAGLLSIQSYAPNAYDQACLETLQALADHCGGALDRIRAQEELQTAQNQLRQSQKMEAFGQLASGVAHDFNNVLAVIRGNAELMLMDSEQLPPEALDGLNEINVATERAANLTRQLLLFSRKQTMRRHPVRLNELLENISKMLRRVLREDIALEFAYSPDLPEAECDPGMIEQVLLNLVVNARDAMPRGGRLTIATGQATLTAPIHPSRTEARPGCFVTIRVADTGFGIPAANLPRLFEPFFTTKPVGEGTGLGLATVYGIVKQHQGWIEVASSEGQGAAFTVYLPVLVQMAEIPDGPQTATATSGATEAILIVEDDNDVRVIMRRMLEILGYTVHEATCGQEALERWQQQQGKIDLLLTDLILPGSIAGRELGQLLRQQHPSLAIVFMSGHAADVLSRNAAPFTDLSRHFLPKPCSSTELARILREALDEQVRHN